MIFYISKYNVHIKLPIFNHKMIGNNFMLLGMCCTLFAIINPIIVFI
jgi:hypothetical protein